MTKEPHFSPKVHPLAREVEADDPLELVATPVGGDPEYMLQCMVEEFAWMGMGADELLGLFHSPEYPVLNQLLDYFGADAVRERIEELLGALGGLRFSAVINDEPEPDEDDGPELIQLGIRDGCASERPGSSRP